MGNLESDKTMEPDAATLDTDEDSNIDWAKPINTLQGGGALMGQLRSLLTHTSVETTSPSDDAYYQSNGHLENVMRLQVDAWNSEALFVAHCISTSGL
eukprot:7448192-Pyramimonas_sp.AAC.1